MTSPSSGAPRRSPASRSTSSEAPRGNPGRSRWRESSLSATETRRTALYSPFVPVSGGAVILSADSALGPFRGSEFTSFAQLWYTVGGTVHVLCALVAIQDSPAYPYRGFMLRLDTARICFPVLEDQPHATCCVGFTSILSTGTSSIARVPSCHSRFHRRRPKGRIVQLICSLYPITLRASYLTPSRCVPIISCKIHL
ncbi:hypothetical protein EDB85DRAFT_819013 [Lactarius pseudohatsudake]|nr:hypothetical protein EDB85DRAFT_819013 [Lactarius pseudohatsudake]